MAKETWSPAVLSKVKKLLEKGMSTAEIGKKIGFSKNAVVGKLNRLGWNTGAAPKKTAAKSAPAKKPVKKSAPVKPVKKPAAKAVPVKKSKVYSPKSIVKKPAVKKIEAKKTEVKKSEPKKAPVKTEKANPKPAIKNQKSLGMHQKIIQHSLEMANLTPSQCRWPIGDPDTENFRFCGAPVFVGKPYCYDHCLAAYQMQPLKKK